MTQTPFGIPWVQHNLTKYKARVKEDLFLIFKYSSHSVQWFNFHCAAYIGISTNRILAELHVQCIAVCV